MSQNVNLLKELLFDEEVREIDELQQRLQEVYNTAGSRERLRASVAEVLNGAIVDAEKRDHDAMRRAVAPLIVKTVETQITSKQHTDFISGAVSKNMGVIVRDYVDSAIKDMMAKINKKLEKAIPGGKRQMRTRAEARGMSMAEIALAETKKLEVEELYLIRRGSGMVLGHWSREAADHPGANAPNFGNNRDAIVGGYLTAITNVAKEAFDMDNAGIRAIQHSDFQIYLRNSPVYTLAAKCSGIPLPGMETAIDVEFQRVIAEHDELIAEAAAQRNGNSSTNGTAAATVSGTAGDSRGERQTKIAEILPNLATSLEASMARTHEELFEEVPVGMSPLAKLALFIGLPLFALLAWLGWQSYWTSKTETLVRGAISDTLELKGYPLDMDVSLGGGSVRLSGLTPSHDVRRDLVAKLRARIPYAQLREELTVLPKAKTIDPAPQIAAVKRDITQLEAKSSRVIDDLAARNAAKLQALEDQIRRALVTRAIDRTARRVAGITPELKGLQQRLDDASQSQTVAASIAQLETAERTLAALGKRLHDSASNSAVAGSIVTVLHEVTGRINAATGALAALGGLGAATPQRGTPRGDAAESAEYLSSAAERLAIVSSSALNAVVLKPVEKQVGTISGSVNVLSKRVDDLLPGSRDRLEAWTRANAIFFGNEAAFLNDGRARRKLDALAELMKENRLLIRLIGYTDETGNAARNAPLALARADKVLAELRRRGIPANRLVAAGRANGPDISAATGAGSANRRVQFEVGFNDEPAGGQ